jgi:hypothetical protein
VIYCFEKELDLASLLEEAKIAFERYAAVTDADSWVVSLGI